MQPPLARKLTSMVGEANVLTGVDCSPYSLDGRTPSAVVFPGANDEVAAVLTLADTEQIPVTPWGGGTAMAIGAPPSRLGLVLCLRRMNRLLEHEPGDLTATVQAGMSLARLQAELGKRGQWLSLDPPNAERATVGGILAGNASGPRRQLYGTARDLLIGISMVLADGSLVRGGGKVVKNVAGYDLPKLAIGSLGTLGVLVEATVKLRPRPDADRLVIARFAQLKDAGQALRAVMGSDLIPSALDLLDAEALRAMGLPAGEGCAFLIGFDGILEQVEWQCAELGRLLDGLGVAETRILDGEARDQGWRAAGEIASRAFPEAAAVMKCGVLPTQVAEIVERAGDVAKRSGLGAAFRAHAGVGIVTAVLSGSGGDMGAVVATIEEWRRLVNAGGGHASVERAPLALKERVAVWDAPGAGHRIMERIKASLDPHAILNPGRFVGGI